jgi:hypothetical protein
LLLFLGYIRADTPHVLWRYTSVPPGTDIYSLISQSLLVSTATSQNNNHINTDRSTRKNNKKSVAPSVSTLLLNSIEKTYHTSKFHKITKQTDRSTTQIKPDMSSSQPTDHESNISNKHRTIIEIECVFDAKGNIPTWFINFMQQSWPHKYEIYNII